MLLLSLTDTIKHQYSVFPFPRTQFRTNLALCQTKSRIPDLIGHTEGPSETKIGTQIDNGGVGVICQKCNMKINRDPINRNASNQDPFGVKRESLVLLRV